MGHKKKIWVVDDERIVRVTLADDLRDAGYDVLEFADALSVLQMLSNETPNVIITDLKMPGIDGIELLIRIKAQKPEITCIVMTAYGTVENAVKAMKLGAFEYILKPLNSIEILIMLNRIWEINSVLLENKLLRKHFEKEYDFASYIGDSNTNRELFDLIKLVAHKDSTVLTTGETGSGKELITNIIHFNSNRKNQPLIKVSCAILSREIFESELFGHVKGAFTGADRDKQGRFELANGGTLYLDDIDDIPMDLQVKLLRVLDQREIERVGSSKTIPIDIRLIASTKKDLRQLVSDGCFREDLFYRLNIFPIILKPLRERTKDVRILLDHFIKKYSNSLDITFTEPAYRVLEKYYWPGNVRELKNISERLAILAVDGAIELEDIPSEIRFTQVFDVCSSVGVKPLDQMMAEIEISSIKCALEKTNNNKSKAASLLGIPPSTLHTKMDKYDMK